MFKRKEKILHKEKMKKKLVNEKLVAVPILFPKLGIGQYVNWANENWPVTYFLLFLPTPS
jgi:hypothetical protein